MKMIPTFCVLGLAGLGLAQATALRASETAPPQESCCESSGDAMRNVYVQAASTDAVTGTATGRVVFDGEVPASQDLSITEAQSAGCTADGSRVNTKNLSLVVGKDKGIANAVVRIAVPDQTLIVPKEPVVLDQIECRFDRHVVVVPVGATLEYKNSDTVSHNVHTYSRKNKPFNRTLPAGASYKQVVKKAESIPIRCDIHPWMKAYVYAVDTNYAALTDEHGAFEIKGLPPGEYTAKIWHESLGKTEVQITIDAAGKSEAVSAPMKPKKKSKRGR